MNSKVNKLLVPPKPKNGLGDVDAWNNKNPASREHQLTIPETDDPMAARLKASLEIAEAAIKRAEIAEARPRAGRKQEMVDPVGTSIKIERALKQRAEAYAQSHAHETNKHFTFGKLVSLALTEYLDKHS